MEYPNVLKKNFTILSIQVPNTPNLTPPLNGDGRTTKYSTWRKHQPRLQLAAIGTRGIYVARHDMFEFFAISSKIDVITNVIT
jgi:hypothetical protein